MASIAELSKQKLLNDLDDKELEIVTKKVAAESHARGGRIIREGDPTKGIFMIRTGKVEISKTTPDGWKQTLAILTEHDFFGELSVIEDRKTHSADALALENTEVYMIPKDDLQWLEQNEPALMFKVMRMIARVASRNIRSMNEKLMKVLISY
jgi:CRP-like cAMP-binding protein